MIVLLTLVIAIAMAAFGVVFFASAKSNSWLALIIFAACGAAVFLLPVASWIQGLGTTQRLILAVGIGSVGGITAVLVLNRRGFTDWLAAKL